MKQKNVNFSGCMCPLNIAFSPSLSICQPLSLKTPNQWNPNYKLTQPKTRAAYLKNWKANNFLGYFEVDIW